MNDATGTALGLGVRNDGTNSVLLGKREHVEESVQSLTSKAAELEKTIADLEQKFKNLSAAKDADERPCLPDHVNILRLPGSATVMATTFTLVRQLEISLSENRNLQGENRKLQEENRTLVASNACLRASEADGRVRYRDLLVRVDKLIRKLEDEIALKDREIALRSLFSRNLEQKASQDLALAEGAHNQAIRDRDFYHQEMHRLQDQLRDLQEPRNQFPQGAVPPVESAMQTHALFRFTETGNDDASSVSSATSGSNETLVEAESEEDDQSDESSEEDDHSGAENDDSAEAEHPHPGIAFINLIERYTESRRLSPSTCDCQLH